MGRVFPRGGRLLRSPIVVLLVGRENEGIPDVDTGRSPGIPDLLIFRSCGAGGAVVFILVGSLFRFEPRDCSLLDLNLTRFDDTLPVTVCLFILLTSSEFLLM
uniref:Uncharacterized protein n=1 Tax=Cacopsylla melanoneura TaxID=428564 RepID=A0A8D9EMC7_9HEMI